MVNIPNISIISGKPSDPGGPLSATEVTAEGCKLEWKPPADNGGSDITNYIVEKKEAGDDYWTKVTGFCTQPHLQVGKLDKGKEYVFRVRAENGHGETSAPLESGLILAKNPYGKRMCRVCIFNLKETSLFSNQIKPANYPFHT